jgi:hypothetical protein
LSQGREGLIPSIDSALHPEIVEALDDTEHVSRRTHIRSVKATSLTHKRPHPREAGRLLGGFAFYAAFLTKPSASIAASTAGRSATRFWKASNAGKPDRSRSTCFAQLVTVNR